MTYLHLSILFLIVLASTFLALSIYERFADDENYVIIEPMDAIAVALGITLIIMAVFGVYPI